MGLAFNSVELRKGFEMKNKIFTFIAVFALTVGTMAAAGPARNGQGNRQGQNQGQQNGQGQKKQQGQQGKKDGATRR